MWILPYLHKVVVALQRKKYNYTEIHPHRRLWEKCPKEGWQHCHVEWQ